MKAMIFAAGLGSRLRPLTDTCPKALIKINGKPMLQIVIENLKRYGFDEIIINIHYLGNQIKTFLQQQNNFGIQIEISDETDEILETGGGLWKARQFFDDEKPFLLCNADILTNLNLNDFLSAHLKDNNLATLAVRKRISSRYLLFDESNILCGWKNTKTNELKIPRNVRSDFKSNIITETVSKNEKDGFVPRHDESQKLQELAFSGYHIISPEIFKHLSRTGKFSMIDWYLDICSEHQIKAYRHDEDIWLDIGSAAELEKAGEVLKSAIF